MLEDFFAREPLYLAAGQKGPSSPLNHDGSKLLLLLQGIACSLWLSV
jgi:hypothetical protein